MTFVEFVSEEGISCAIRSNAHAILPLMSNLIEDAVHVLRTLPENVQAAAARAIIEYAAGQDDDLHVSDAQVTEIERRMADPNRTFLSLDDVRSKLRHFGV